MADTATTDRATEPDEAAVAEPSEKPFPYTRVAVLTWVVRVFGVAAALGAGATWVAMVMFPAYANSMFYGSLGVFAVAALAFALGGCRRPPDLADDLGDEFDGDEVPYEIPEVVHRDVGDAVREVVETVRSWTDADLDAAQDAYEKHWTPKVDVSAQHVYNALIDHFFVTDQFDPDPRRLDVYIVEMKDTVGGAADVILALYARDRKLCTGPQFALLTKWWTESGLPLPARSEHVATAEDLAKPDPAARSAAQPGKVHYPTVLLPGELEQIASGAVDVDAAPPPPGPVPNQ